MDAFVQQMLDKNLDVAHLTVLFASSFNSGGLSINEQGVLTVADVKSSDPYYGTRLQEIRTEIAALALKADEVLVRENIDSIADALIRATDAQEKSQADRVRIYDMIRQVEQWNPPMPLTGLRERMLKSLREAAKEDSFWDYHIQQLSARRYLDGPTLRQQAIEQLTRDLEYYQARYEEQLKQSAEHAEWLRALRENLPTAEIIP